MAYLRVQCIKPRRYFPFHFRVLRGAISLAELRVRETGNGTGTRLRSSSMDETGTISFPFQIPARRVPKRQRLLYRDMDRGRYP